MGKKAIVISAVLGALTFFCGEAAARTPSPDRRRIAADEARGFKFSRDKRTLLEARDAVMRGNIRHYTIPNGVTKIGDYAFSCCMSLNSVTIPDSVTEIGRGAFAECYGLRRLTIPAGVRKIAEAAFRCSPRVEVSSKNRNFATDDYGALIDLNSGKLLHFPSGVSGSYAIPDGVTGIGAYAFQHCSLNEVIIPPSVTWIGERAFENSQNLRYVTIPNGVTHIGRSAFSGCHRLNEVIIPPSVTEVGDRAFSFSGCESQVKRDYPHLFR